MQCHAPMQGNNRKVYKIYRSTYDPQSRGEGESHRRPGPHGHRWSETETRIGWDGERNIHHADCINVRVDVRSGEHPGSKQHRHTSLNTLIPARCEQRHPGGRHNRPKAALPQPDGYHTPSIHPHFFALAGRRATSFSHQIEIVDKCAITWRLPRGEQAPSISSR